ncbi:MAG: hypothetical protein EBY07_14660, partial [Actinobacteria bacterium]|nr:hypothetical protein [Actinomycetota bacterium]
SGFVMLKIKRGTGLDVVSIVMIGDHPAIDLTILQKQPIHSMNIALYCFRRHELGANMCIPSKIISRITTHSWCKL